ncbi:MAG: GNAT family N-acetyltransferase [Chitinophagaceae bacterium]|nr:GNAT family N-acetyltransferase [Chitinophagaceae bacterium]
MCNFSDPAISTATVKDVTAIKDLLNSAYRGESSKKGWTTEAHLIAGDTRSDETNVLHHLQQPGSVFLKHTQPDGKITGSVNLQQHGHKIYLGMFSVSPAVQGGGIGKQLLLAAEEYAKQLHCNTIYMTVISLRTELIHWYMRHGYKDTGERKPFREDRLTGKHLQQLEFMVLEKNIA